MSTTNFDHILVLTVSPAVEECCSRALPEEEGFESLTNIELDEGAELHQVSLNGLDSSSPEKIEATGADSMITEHEKCHVP
jgi:hypothetical protein